MKIINTKGKLCPEPLILAKKAFAELQNGEQIEILSDNETSYKNLMRFLTDTKANPKSTQVGNVYSIVCVKNDDCIIHSSDAELYCELPAMQNIQNYAISITSNKMGNGNDELGELLIKAFVNTIIELDSLPSVIVFYNTGVLLTQNDSAVYDSLNSLENAGIDILICGACIDYFDIKSNVSIGQISNMYDISNALVNADKIVTP